MSKQWLSIREAVRETGLSETFLRRGVKDGTIPHIQSGVKALINRDQLREVLAQMAKEDREHE